ncbi:hypothetical protein ACHAXA_001737 [Cyclostephanos tholiformis]|jgi:hypothetical protein|uniref:BZIP domain-containing protein n=1 Tax=Cyclostephanos tholiformis TaxID=382380 RepID=A0ABD3SD17_9STRA
MTHSEWDDIPTSSELFGGDFFGDELMEMYTADHGLNLGDNSGSVITISAAAAGASCGYDDVSKHPGILVAMNAAAMDGGLSPLGSSMEFIPMSAPSDSSLPPFHALQPPVQVNSTAVAAPLSAQASLLPPPTAVSSAPQPATAATFAKIPIAVVPAPPQGSPTKKRKGATHATATTTSAVPQAKVARSGGVKVGVPASVLNRIVSTSASNLSQAVTATAAAAARPPSNTAATLSKKPLVPAIKSITVPTEKTSFGGEINRQVIARPSAVHSSVVPAPHRVAPPASSFAAPTKDTSTGKLPDAPTSSSSAVNVKIATTEADFKDIASAAVSSLIQNVSSTPPNPCPTPVAIKPGGGTNIDTSTAHINALTSQNWVTACGNPIAEDAFSSDASVGGGTACDKAARNARRATLSQEERAKQNRDRNREHARNTRLRKKAYVEELKRTLTELVSQRDAAEIERRHEAQRNREQREVRFRVMEEFLKLRGRNEPNAARWVAILEEGFAFSLPRTPFRRMVDGNKSWMSDELRSGSDQESSFAYSEQVLRGADAVIEDSVHLAEFLNSIGRTCSSDGESSEVRILYQCDRKRFFMDGNVAFMDFHASSFGTVARGLANEVFFKGSMKALFSPASNKLISIDMTFDTASIVHQVDSMGIVAMSDAAASAAAHEADALLDSLQMPQMFVDNINGAPLAPGAMSVSSDDGERSTDD